MLQKDSVLSQGFFCIMGDIMQDILYNAAVTYRNLRNIRYEIRLGRKGKAYDLMIQRIKNVSIKIFLRGKSI